MSLADITREGGYYIYRAVTTKNIWDKIEIGDIIEASNVRSVNYNGLIECDGRINIRVLNSQEATAKGFKVLSNSELEDLISGTPIDELLLNNSKELMYKTSAKVSLTDWVVKSIYYDTNASSGGMLVELTKTEDGKMATIKVKLYKWSVELGSERANGIMEALSNVRVGNIVSVKGVLFHYDNFEIHAVEKDWITNVDAHASLEKTVYQTSSFLIDGISYATLVSTINGNTISVLSTDGRINIKLKDVELSGTSNELDQEAKEKVDALLKDATSIIIETTDSQAKLDSTGDNYLAYVWFKRPNDKEYKNLNLILVRSGLATSFLEDMNEYYSAFKTALEKAQEEKLGMWAE